MSQAKLMLQARTWTMVAVLWPVGFLDFSRALS